MIAKGDWLRGLAGLVVLGGAIALHAWWRERPPAPRALELQVFDAIEAGDEGWVTSILAADPSAASAVRRGRGRAKPRPVIETALTFAARKGRKGIATLLLDAGADPNRGTDDGHLPMHAAAECTSEEDALAVVRLLLSRGARADAATQSSDTPLHSATPRPELMKLLLASGARADAANSRGWTPLHLAARAQLDTEAVKLLLDAGARPDGRITWVDPLGGTSDRLRLGDTPLHAAARSGIAATAVLLCASGADPTAVNDEGETPLGAARARSEEARDSGHEWSIWTARDLVEALGPGGACATARAR